MNKHEFLWHMSKQLKLDLDIDEEFLTLLDAEFDKIQKIIDWNDLPVVKAKPAGMACNKCKDFNEYAEPNQQDGTHLCYRCRNRV